MTTTDPRELARAERAKRRAAKEATSAPAPEATSGPRRRKDGTLSARDLPCLCGCGAATTTKDARFLSGHDAKLRKAVLAAGGSADALPEVVRPFFADGEVVAGLALVGDVLQDRKRGGPVA